MRTFPSDFFFLFCMDGGAAHYSEETLGAECLRIPFLPIIILYTLYILDISIYLPNYKSRSRDWAIIVRVTSKRCLHNVNSHSSLY